MKNLFRKRVLEAIFIIVISLILVPSVFGQEAFIINDNLHCPDWNFKKALLDDPSINTNGDTRLSVREAHSFSGTIDVHSKNIANLAGIEIFVNLTGLICYNNKLTSLNLAKNTALISLDCRENLLTRLDLSLNTALENLTCSRNHLYNLNLSNNIALKKLDCSSNWITSLDISSNIALEDLDCNGNGNLTSLDISNNIAIKQLICDNNRRLTNLDVSNNPALTKLHCYNSSLTSIDLSNNLALNDFNCKDNQITKLDLSNNPALRHFDCRNNNQLIYLNLKNGSNWNMAYLKLEDNPNLLYIIVDNINGQRRGWRKDDHAIYYSDLEKIQFLSDSLTLVDLYKRTGGDNWTTPWNLSEPLESWNGVSLSNDRVTMLNLGKNNMSGSLPRTFRNLTALTHLSINNNQFNNIDLSGNIALQSLDCDDNNLTLLDLSKNTDLLYLYCTNNQLTSLDLSKNTRLTILSCGHNQLTSLDIANTDIGSDSPLYTQSNENLLCIRVDNDIYNIAYSQGAWRKDDHTYYCVIDVADYLALRDLYKNTNGDNWTNQWEFTEPAADWYGVTIENGRVKELDLSNNGLIGHIPIGNLTALTHLNLKDNQITNLDVSQNLALTYLNLPNNQITNLDVSQNLALTYLNLPNNQITNLDVSQNLALIYLGLQGNQLTSLDVSKNILLEKLYCKNNQLTSLDISNNTALLHIYCGINQLTSLDISKNTALATLGCIANQLTDLDLSQHSTLTRLFCRDNQLVKLNIQNGNNSNMTKMVATGNPDLICIAVDDVSAIPSSWQKDEYVDYCYAEEQLFLSDSLALVDLYNSTGGTSWTNSWNMNQPVSSWYGVTSSTDRRVIELKLRDNNLSGIVLPSFGRLTELKVLDLRKNQLTSLDISGNTALIHFSCGDNEISRLNLTQNKDLVVIGCSNNQLTRLDITKNKNLEKLYCVNNRLTGLNLRENIALTHLYCDGNSIHVEVDRNTALLELSCKRNSLRSLDLSNNTNLTKLICSHNALRELDIRNGNNLNMRIMDATRNVTHEIGNDYYLSCILTDLPAERIPSSWQKDWRTSYCQENRRSSRVADDTTKVDNPSSSDSEVETTESYQIEVYPNPAVNHINISVTGLESGRNIPFRLYNTFGREVLRGDDLENGSNRIALTDISRGLYMLEIHYGSDNIKYVEILINDE